MQFWEARYDSYEFFSGEEIICVDNSGLNKVLTIGKTYRCLCRADDRSRVSVIFDDGDANSYTSKFRFRKKSELCSLDSNSEIDGYIEKIKALENEINELKKSVSNLKRENALLIKINDLETILKMEAK